MADIKVTCPQCKAALTVSEYVDITAVKCRVCGTAMEIPESADGTGRDIPSIRLAPPKASPEPVGISTTELNSMERNRKVRQFMPQRLSKPPKIKRRRSKPVSVFRYWILFVVVLLVALLLRRGDIIQNQAQLEIMIQGVIIFLGILHVAVIAQAFHDDVFQGVLCVFVPFYSVYYLLRQSDALVMRAVGMALLLVFSLDLMDFLIDTAAMLYYRIDDWISSGGA